MWGLWREAGVVPKGPPGFPHPTYIPLLSSEIRMSKPLEAEKQGLDSPSEHTDTERNGPDTNHQVRREWMSRRGGKGEKGTEGAPVGEGQGVGAELLHLTLPIPHPNFFFLEPPE